MKAGRLFVLCVVLLFVGGLLTLFLTGVGKASEHLNSPPAAPDQAGDVHLPVVRNQYPSEDFTHLELNVDREVISAGQRVSLTVTTLNDFEEPIHDSFFDVFVTVGGRSQEDAGDQVPLTSHGDGTYTGAFTPTVTGKYYLSAGLVDEDAGDKSAETDEATVDVVPTEMVALDLVGANPQQLRLLGRDQFQNPIPTPSPSAVDCTSDNPDIQPTPAQVDPQMPDWALAVGVQAIDYGTAEFTCEHLPTDHTVTETVAHTPWGIQMRDAENQPGRGFRTDSFFDVYVGINPPGDGTAWQTVTGTMTYSGTSGANFGACQPTTPQFEVVCLDEPGAVHFNVLATSGVSEPTTPFTMSFTTPPTATDIMEDRFTVADLNLYDTTFTPITYDPVILEPFNTFQFAVKPTRQLTMQVYIVEGAATNDDVVEDVEILEFGFNLNALLCTCDSYVEIDLVTTTIPITDWRTIDEDGDGLDRFDRNDDGDYDDKGENDDLQNAEDEGYFDDGADTENVYYVPGMRGGPLGRTHAPDGQIAIDNGQDFDNFTLLHEKVHELDLRKDGDFDVNDSPDDPANDQGARDPGNVMNYDDMGPIMTPEQCEELF